jgi:hypothetical protein
MRRYGVRLLVAVLTFGIGVALSFALGLFRVPQTRISHRWSESSSCRKNFRIDRPSLLTVDNQPNDPLQLAYLGATSHSEMAGTTGTRLLIENKSNKTITGYAISSEKSWREHGKSGVAFRDWTGNVLLEPGESHSIDLPRSIEGGLLLRVQWVGFQDGSSWNNPRITQ